MTEKLKTLMDEVTGMVDQDFATPDLDAIVRTGDRAVRRRRLTAGVAALAVAAVASTGAVLLGSRGGDEAGFADDELATDVPMWALGSDLHVADRTYDLGVDVVTLVRTADGVAYLGDDSGVYLFDGNDSERIGTSVDSDWAGLVGDSDGTWVGWVDDSGDERDYVARDLASGAQFRDPVRVDPRAEPPLDAGMFLAIDGTTAYLLDARGTLRTDLVTGSSTVLGTADDPQQVVAVEDGVTVRWIENSTGGDIGTDVVDDTGRVLLGHDHGRTVGALSPDGAWALGLEDGSVWGVRTGRQVPLDTGASDAVGYEWLDDDTVMVLSEVEGTQDTIRLKQCEVPAGTCTDVADVNLTDERFALPSFGLFSAMQFGGSSASGSAEATVESSPS